jgi:phosphohistidine phosphatase
VKLFLVRHGDADPDVPEGLDDDARPLTTRGRLALPAHFSAVAPRIGQVNIILTSPLVRAVQTATLLAQALAFDGPMKVSRALFPDGPVGALEALLGQYPEASVVLVGHQPSMGAATAHFLGMSSFPRQVSPGTVVGIERPDAGGAGRLFLFASVGQPISDSL